MVGSYRPEDLDPALVALCDHYHGLCDELERIRQGRQVREYPSVAPS
jgi:hypothetical protein